MSIAFDPNETVDVCLTIDKEKPDEDRQAFICRYLTARESRKFARLRDEAFVLKKNDRDKEDAKTSEAFAIALVGWRNVKDRQGNELPFSVDAIEDAVTYKEKWDLLWRIPDAITVGELEKKAYGSPAPAEPAQSAPGAAGGNAATSQPS